MSQFSWFDVHRIVNGVATDGDELSGPMTPKIWIDLDRGIFYYGMTD